MPEAAVSIIVPVLNEAAGVVACLTALAPLRAQGAEVLVVDGGSSDATVELAQGLADAVLMAPRGRAAQMNAGARAARHDTLLFLHADTGLPPDALKQVLGALADGAPWGRFDVRITGRHGMLKVVAASMNLRSRLTGIATGDQAFFMRREAFERVGGFPHQALMEDVEMARRLLALGRPACLVQKVSTSGRRWESRGVWRTIFLMWRLRWRYWRGESPEALARAYR